MSMGHTESHLSPSAAGKSQKLLADRSGSAARGTFINSPTLYNVVLNLHAEGPVAFSPTSSGSHSICQLRLKPTEFRF